MQKKVLIVDDVEMNREILAMILEDEYPVMQAEDGEQAIRLLETHHDEIAVVLLDLIMPKKDGYEVLRFLNTKEWTDQIPILVISGESSVEVERECFTLGVSDFVRKPFDNVMVKKRVTNIVDLFSYKNELELKVEKQTKTLKQQYHLLHEQAETLRRNNRQIIDVLGAVVETRDLESGEHIMRVKGFTQILAQHAMEDYPEYGLTPKQIQIIVMASALHDVGKIAIPDNILLKPARLTDEEFEIMKSHTTRGCEIIKKTKGAWDENYGKVSYEICRHHHERYDGRGYPDKLVGEDIPLSAQLVSIADVYDALVSERVYKKSFSKDDAFHMILNGECGIFSPKLLECFRKSKEEFEALADLQHGGEIE